MGIISGISALARRVTHAFGLRREVENDQGDEKTRDEEAPESGTVATPIPRNQPLISAVTHTKSQSATLLVDTLSPVHTALPSGSLEDPLRSTSNQRGEFVAIKPTKYGTPGKDENTETARFSPKEAHPGAQRAEASDEVTRAELRSENLERLHSYIERRRPCAFPQPTHLPATQYQRQVEELCHLASSVLDAERLRAYQEAGGAVLSGLNVPAIVGEIGLRDALDFVRAFEKVGLPAVAMTSGAASSVLSEMQAINWFDGATALRQPR